jgi:hypothetical protein
MSEELATVNDLADAVVANEEDPSEQEAYAQYVHHLFTVDPDEFAKWKAADRDVALFVLIREAVGECRGLRDEAKRIVDMAEEKIGYYTTEEGISELTSKLTSGLFSGKGMMGLLG